MRWVIGILAFIMVTVVAAVGFFAIRFPMSLPDLAGELSLPGLHAQAAIDRDAHGLVTIHAANDHDAYYALGYAHAQDRLWQMEMTRRIGAGRMSELLGSSMIGLDRYIRTLGFYRLAEAQLQHLSPNVLASLDAYAEGVNAWIETRDRPLPPEFQLLFHEPEPWVPADSIVWARMMAFQLATNMRSEQARERLLRELGEEKVRALLPGAEPNGPVTLPPAAKALLDRYVPAPAELQSDTASNAWVISGQHTVTGAPILANDPHLGFTAPNLWYFARIDAPNLQVTGVTVPGVPFHLLGHNAQVAWGLTTTYADTQDLFIETLSPDGRQYKTPAGWHDFEYREEEITVRFGDPISLSVRSSRHGPIVSDLWEKDGNDPTVTAALAFPGLDVADRTPEALYRLNRAGNAQAVLEATRFYGAPVQNIHFADSQGSIGLIAPGRIPMRANGNGLLPVDGGSGSYDWIGMIPFAELPKVVDPPSGIIRNANNRLVDQTFPHLISAEWPPAFRAKRLDMLLERMSKTDVAQNIDWQLDIVSGAATEILPLLLVAEPDGEESTEALALLSEWDGSMDRDKAAPLIYATWLNVLTLAIAKDEVKGAYPPYWQEQELFLINVLKGEEAAWCDDVQTAETEDCAQVLSASLDETVTQLQERFGDDIADWRWGAAHVAIFENRFLGRLPGLNGFANLRIETSGGDHTLNRGQSTPSSDPLFRHGHGAGYRAVYDLADLANSRFSLAGGQSGNPVSPHYDDLLDDWRDGRYFRSGGRVGDIDPAAERILVLNPR
ncbi:penicillin acylase family protein [Hwanghaeella grinnelliae]|uniref:Penicillin acylase family protein n=1 Tax=Hwanghaeella grinnelliae TaxID=2500179 RepID=A0A3S2ZAC2_9PROT|nr:penicillin acylase family protein [Hwanghaeella grinnelliae]RVU39187.1 penicillin acylase family protein [Hwanghaeella grinnelliae]